VKASPGMFGGGAFYSVIPADRRESRDPVLFLVFSLDPGLPPPSLLRLHLSASPIHEPRLRAGLSGMTTFLGSPTHVPRSNLGVTGGPMAAATLMPPRFDRSQAWVLRSRAHSLAEGPRGESIAHGPPQDDIGYWFRTFNGLSRT